MGGDIHGGEGLPEVRGRSHQVRWAWLPEIRARREVPVSGGDRSSSWAFRSRESRASSVYSMPWGSSASGPGPRGLGGPGVRVLAGSPSTLPVSGTRLVSVAVPSSSSSSSFYIRKRRS